MKKEKKRRSMTDRRKREHKGSGGGFAFKTPEIPQFAPKKPEEYQIDIIPFTAGKNNPFASKGELYYERTYHQHSNIGPNRDKVICNLATFKTACYICEYRSKMSRTPGERTKESKDAFNSLLPKQRQVFLVRDRAEMKKGLQFFESSWHTFGKFLDNKLTAGKGEQKKIRENFAEPEGGSTLVITGLEKSAGDGKFIEFSDIQFEPRKKALTEELLEAAPCIDDWFEPANYKEVKKTFLAAMGEPDEQSEDEDDSEDNEEWDSEEEKDKESDEEEDEDSEEGEEEDDDSDSEDEDEDSEEDEEDSESPCKKGDFILFKHKKEKLKGKVIAVGEDSLRLRVKGMKDPLNVDFDAYVKTIKSAYSDEDDEPRKKKRK